MDDGREWLEADGLGGYAMGCADGIRTRRYHALLLAATRPPEGRMVLVADLEVFVETRGGRFALSSHRYRGDAVFPDGSRRLAAFDWQPWPRWEWALDDGTKIALELAIAPGAPRVALRWTRIAGAGPAKLLVRPMLAGRDYHALHHENAAFRFAAELRGQSVRWQPYDSVPAISALANARYDHAPDWYRNFLYAWERERGLDCEEDLAAPGTFTFDLAAPAALVFAAGELDGDARELVDHTFAAERTRRAAFPSPLHRAADAYFVRRGSGKTVIAGYPWFADWGRDTFVSLRGLGLGRPDVARDILLQWAGAVSEGMLPNRYSVDEQPEYNSVDAALWFVIAAEPFAREPAIARAIQQIVDGYSRGTRHRIRADADGLLACGEPGLQLTWMDAKVGGDVITPRIGKPVEIQALWCNALSIAGRRDAFERARAALVEKFWDPARRQLHDVIDCDHVPGRVDATCRPNQLFAVGGLPLLLVDGERARAIVAAVERALWTPAGPRSLAPADERYRGRYVGGVEQRDRSYHNGPVWPWLAGAFVEAWVRVRGGGPDVIAEARTRFLAPLLARLDLAGLGHLSEICDGDPPWRPVGCPFQAWSMAELLRLDQVVLR
jgi:predicted glycogen debranching enzyme